MLDFAIPVLYALLVWWLGTGIVLYVARLPERTYRLSLSIAAVAAITAIAVIGLTNRMTSPLGAYIAFTAAIVVWGFIELLFLTGKVVGPDRSLASPAATGWKRWSHAVAAIIHHELALVAGGAAIFAATYAASNRLALWIYALLWLMRLSAKLNLFLGVPNLHDELLPKQLAHLRGHFRRGPASPLLPASIVLSGLAAGWLAFSALSYPTSGFAATERVLMAALLALATLEHVFMLVSLPVMNLWNWRGPHPEAPPPSQPNAIVPTTIHKGADVSASVTRRG